MKNNLLLYSLIISLFFSNCHLKLSNNAVSSNSNKPVVNYTFIMPVEEIFTLPQGTVVTGRIELGSIKTGDPVDIVGFSKDNIKSECIGIEMHKKNTDVASAGENVGIILKDVRADQLKKGMIISAPDILEAKDKFKSEVYFLSEQEGGLDYDIKNDLSADFSIRTANISGQIKLESKSVSQGNKVDITVELKDPVALSKDLQFSIRIGNRTIGAGKITEILP